MPRVPLRYAIIFFLFVCSQISWLAILLHRPALVQPGQIDRDVTNLGGPCMAVKQWEYVRHGPIGFGNCRIRYKDSRTAATVELQITQGTLGALATADTVTDDGPLASLKWRVTHGEETPWQVVGDK
jgi:hypothetical protein